MKYFLLLFLTGIAFFLPAQAQTPAKLEVAVGRESKETRSRISVKFISVAEDSRCPEGALCVWAGNAKLNVKIRRGSGAWKTVQLNTGIAPQSFKINGYEVTIDSLTPASPDSRPLAERPYVAKFLIRKI